MILCISVLSVVISQFSFLILLIWLFALFFLMSLANSLSILFIFSKKPAFSFVDFCYSLLCFFFIISAQIFMISFLLLTLGFFVSYFSSCFWFKVRLFIWFFFFLLLILGIYCFCFCSSYSSCFRCKARLSIWCFSCFLR